ncbi:Ser/Thr protein kinase RdoA involved in Cpx stress response, MazF antagonist [Paenibacillus sp. 1_12]|uniref:phosphotransferase enzyme family protein n=1 Tax=Paenibacillus sp. 1_12 TaxID=1566278 RepID=UPI0008DF8E2D|nr:phosphotransferase [Paenibacillus sp. 1_12]SFL57411.1 Ser/Thr protein kinase RdoA involved in Cpx stress response, MazF antagonist [Paenibacillus sp. 1_12]
MIHLIKLDSEEEIKKIIAHSKQAALRALQSYDLEWKQIRYNQLSDTCTFVIETANEGLFLLRIHTGISREEINSEIDWLDALSEKIDVMIPKGIKDRNGSKTVKVDLENGYSCYASLMCWVEGEQLTGNLTEDQIYNEGILLAKLHQVSQEFEISANFVRPVWGEQSFRRAMSRLAHYYDRFLTEDEFQLYQLAAEKVLSSIGKLTMDKEMYGLIHGDLHQGNIVFHKENPRPIDFGRCGFGYFFYDIAHTLLGLYPKQREVVLKGYTRTRKLEGDWLSVLESFTVMVMIENYAHHAPDPRETEGLKEEQPYAQAIIKKYLIDAPFLFHPIEIKENGS